MTLQADLDIFKLGVHKGYMGVKLNRAILNNTEIYEFKAQKESELLRLLNLS